jgi:hypothetical protein
MSVLAEAGGGAAGRGVAVRGEERTFPEMGTTQLADT